MCKQYDSVKLLNNLIHHNNIVDEDVLDYLMEEYDIFIFLKKILTKDMKVSSVYKNNTVHFIIETKTAKAFNKLLDTNNENITRKKKIFIIHAKSKESNIIDIYFKREE